MRNQRFASFLALLLLPLSAQALTPVGAPLTIAADVPCSFITDLEVIATPKGAVDVVWVDGWEEFVKSQRFGRDLQTGGPVENLLLVHGGLNVIHPVGTWAGRYELALNVLDFGEDPSDPEAAYRMSLDLDGIPIGEPGRFETKNFVKIAPAAGGDSLQFRFEPPYFGPASCRSRGILASRIDPGGSPISVESRVTRRAPGWAGAYLEVDRQPNDTFVAAYATCDQFSGVVDLEPSPAGDGYLLLFQAAGSDRFRLFAQALDTQGVPQGVPVALTKDGQRGLTGAIASLPDGRWLVVTRAQGGTSEACTEQLVGTILAP